jgi:uncharacterized membrane protein
MVGRADVWRMRMDATTNWAIGATAAVASFALGNAAAPHYVVHLAPLMTLCFLLLEARRLTFHRLWQDRVLLLERALIRPAIGGADPEEDGRGFDALAPQLGTSVPTMPLGRAVARRLRRVYGFLFAVQLVAWGLKLANHPMPAASSSALVERARVGIVSGEVVIAVAVAAFVVAVVFAAVAGGPRDTWASNREGVDGR